MPFSLPVMMHHQSAMWVLGHKVTFDIMRRYIIVNDGVTDLDIKVDVFSDMKEWMGADERARRQRPPVRSIGGDATVSGQRAGDIYFTQHGWRLVIDLSKVRVTGALFSDDFETAYLNKSDLVPVFPAVVSSLVTGVDLSAIPTADQNTESVLNAILDQYNIEGSTAEALKLLNAILALSA